MEGRGRRLRSVGADRNWHDHSRRGRSRLRGHGRGRGNGKSAKCGLIAQVPKEDQTKFKFKLDAHTNVLNGGTGSSSSTPSDPVIPQPIVEQPKVDPILIPTTIIDPPGGGGGGPLTGGATSPAQITYKGGGGGFFVTNDPNDPEIGKYVARGISWFLIDAPIALYGTLHSPITFSDRRRTPYVDQKVTSSSLLTPISITHDPKIDPTKFIVTKVWITVPGQYGPKEMAFNCQNCILIVSPAPPGAAPSTGVNRLGGPVRMSMYGFDGASGP